MNCWICGALAKTGEHKTKQSDLRDVLGKPTQARPFYYHDGSVRNRPIGSYKGEFLKSSGRLCARCNNEVSQPYDRAWERMSNWLRKRQPPLRPGNTVRMDRIFPMDTARQTRNVHLFFTKLTGCHLIEAGLKFDQAALAKSILSGTPNPYIHLKVGISRTGWLIGTTDLHAATLASNNEVAFAAWVYALGSLVVHVMYAIKGERRNGLINSWHPRTNAKRLTIAAFP
jgi:hypothetical protein